MKVLLDTDICSYLLKRTHPALVDRVRASSPGELSISAVTVFELEFGARRLPEADRWLDVIGAFLANLEILPFDTPAAREAAGVRAELESDGRPIGAYDLLIAGHARALGATLVTNNTRGFSRVGNLRIDNWVQR